MGVSARMTTPELAYDEDSDEWVLMLRYAMPPHQYESFESITQALKRASEIVKEQSITQDADDDAIWLSPLVVLPNAVDGIIAQLLKAAE